MSDKITRNVSYANTQDTTTEGIADNYQGAPEDTVETSVKTVRFRDTSGNQLIHRESEENRTAQTAAGYTGTTSIVTDTLVCKNGTTVESRTTTLSNPAGRDDTVGAGKDAPMHRLYNNINGQFPFSERGIADRIIASTVEATDHEFSSSPLSNACNVPSNRSR